MIYSSYLCISELSAQLLDNTVTCVSVGVMSVLYSGLVMLLPEMRGIDFPETIEDVENLNGYVCVYVYVLVMFVYLFTFMLVFMFMFVYLFTFMFLFMFILISISPLLYPLYVTRRRYR